MINHGVTYLGNGRYQFRVWAPKKRNMFLHLIHPDGQRFEMNSDKQGYYSLDLETSPGSRYFYIPEGGMDYPDPASHYQPEGVHGPSEVICHSAYEWHDSSWKGIPFHELIFYELHTGTFSQTGTFEAIIPFLDELRDTGINALQLMPVAQFPGNRNWGYDGVFPYAVQNSYGGPEGLKQLVDACHQKGIAVFLDVVYNHIGPEGNYLTYFGPYFSGRYHTPWGEALNYDGKWSDGVRDYFTDNALFWFEYYHLDGLRCDATHEVYDKGAVNIWEFMQCKVRKLEQELGRPLYLVAENDLNNPKVVKAPEVGGLGFTAQWLDDFHHALYVLLDKKGKTNYPDFGNPEQLAKAYTDGFVHSGEYVKFRKRKHGASSSGISGDHFVVFNQNHDQIGNRAMAERLSSLVSFERLKIAAAALLLSPYVPMLFMGEEYGEENPFFYFVSHSDINLIRAVREGRKKDFAKLKWKSESPDPQDEKTFIRSKLQWEKRTEGEHAILLQWHTRLIEIRCKFELLRNLRKNNVRVSLIEREGLVLSRQSDSGHEHLIAIFNFSERPVNYILPYQEYQWQKVLDSKDREWLGTNEEALTPHPNKARSEDQFPINPLSVVLYKSSRS